MFPQKRPSPTVTAAAIVGTSYASRSGRKAWSTAAVILSGPSLARIAVENRTHDIVARADGLSAGQPRTKLMANHHVQYLHVGLSARLTENPR
jgi:hypothetical protein